MDKEILEKVVKLYFGGCTAREAIDIVKKSLELEEAKVSKGWKYQQLVLGGTI